MNTCKNLYNQYRDYWIFIALLFVMTAFTGIFNQISIFELLIFLCFQVFCVFFPGIAIMILMPIKNLKKIEKILFAYALGYILTMLNYTLLMLVGGKKYLKVAFIVMAILAIGIVFFRLKDLKIEAEEKTNWRGGGLAILAVFFVSLIVFSLRWKIPCSGGGNSYNGDFLYWVGDIVALKKKVPPLNFRTLSDDYRYHYLGALQQAVVSNVTGISAMKVATCYSYIESSVFLGLASYVLVNRTIRGDKVKCITLFLMLFATGWEEIAVVSYIWHIYIVPMSYHIAQSFGVMVILLLMLQLEKKKLDINNMIVLVCCLFCCTGTKGATGAVIFCGLFVGYFYLFFYKHERKTAVVYSVFSIVSFGLVYLYLMSATKTYATLNYEPSVFWIDYQNGLGGILKSFIQSGIEWIVIYIKYLVRTNPWTIVPSVGFIIYTVIRKSIKIEYIIFFSMVFIGTILGYAIQYYGHSQMYFTLTVFPFAAVLTGKCIENLFSYIQSSRKQLLLTGSICTIVVIFTLCNNYKTLFNQYFTIGIQNINIPNYYSEEEWLGWPISYARYEASIWIRENTDEEALLLSDMNMQGESDLVGILAERYVFSDTNEEMLVDRQNCYQGDRTALERYLNLGIDYIVQTKRISPLFICPEDMGEIVFENGEIAVYKLFG